MGEPAKWVYSFTVWPSETWGFTRALFDYFRMFLEGGGGRVDMEFTPEEFERFRSLMNHDGFTLREVERVPYHEPESVL